jgi:hypothetical protein
MKGHIILVQPIFDSMGILIIGAYIEVKVGKVKTFSVYTKEVEMGVMDFFPIVGTTIYIDDTWKLLYQKS